MNASPMLSPLVAFAVVFVAVAAGSWVLSRMAFRRQGPDIAGFAKPYACGEDAPGILIQPNYSQFLPFAFFFTILHVVVLTIATVPVEVGPTLGLAVLYVLGGLMGLSILYRK